MRSNFAPSSLTRPVKVNKISHYLTSYISHNIYSNNADDTDFQSVARSNVTARRHWCRLPVSSPRHSHIPNWQRRTRTRCLFVYRPVDRQSHLGTSPCRPAWTRHTSYSPSAELWSCSWAHDSPAGKLSAPRPAAGRHYYQFLQTGIISPSSITQNSLTIVLWYQRVISTSNSQSAFTFLLRDATPQSAVLLQSVRLSVRLFVRDVEISWWHRLEIFKK